MPLTFWWVIFLLYRKDTCKPVRAMLKLYQGKYTRARMKALGQVIFFGLADVSTTTRFCSRSLFLSLNLLTPWQFTLLLPQIKALSSIPQSHFSQLLHPSPESPYLAVECHFATYDLTCLFKKKIESCGKTIMHLCLYTFSSYKQDKNTFLIKPSPVSA